MVNHRAVGMQADHPLLACFTFEVLLLASQHRTHLPLGASFTIIVNHR
eukprot:CAMPEP_0119358210 /NCGR_PEP_ID=MMETSP1334-20130426/6464_1 /TAXON_ID=127549 /ORGANISM="Calcidiscus leptoporus, Strain RCC1130" /LENGTH=47 /DNA_ID= /DNA_START= /DNA_END= /DNA_ORIENTATION=